MKKISILIMAVVLLFGANSCKKDDIAELLPSMKATIGAKAWNTSVAAGYKYNKYLTILGGVTGDNMLISIVTDKVEAKTYKFSVGITTGVTTETYATYYQKNDAGNKTYLATSGEVTITKIDGKKISGTFKFSAAASTSDAIEVKDGVFENVSYTEKSEK